VIPCCQGLSRRTGIPTGTWAIIVGAAVLLLWIPLRQRPGLGTLCNVILVGTVIGGTVGVGTVVYAVCIGPLAHIFVPLFSRPAAEPAEARTDARPPGPSAGT
jgi:uncharacterized membrane protein YczE